MFSDLRLMGESNAIMNRSGGISYESFSNSEKIYKDLYADDDNNLSLTFQIIYFMAWNP